MVVENGKGGFTPVQVDWRADQYWRNRRLTPSQLQIHDVRIEDTGRRDDENGMLEMREVLSSTLLPVLEHRDALANSLNVEEFSKNRNEQTHFKNLASEYGWMNCLRKDLRKCRWIHISSKFSQYLTGCLFALSDWSNNPPEIIAALHRLEHCVHQQERFSKHGRYFAPFFEYLSNGDGDIKKEDGPMLLSVPFLDWSVEGTPPPLRFQIDPREGYQSSKSSSHLLRSILQHFYRLEDTTDRESQQVFTRHKPWQTDRNLDLKVRRWYGHYPKSLNVDELWILVVDSRHIVTFSSNQSWKSRWPPLQLSARIMEVSFRGIRNNFLNSATEQDYTSTTHVITTLSGALGMLHRNRFASYLGQLQYRLHRSPSTKLVMDLLQVQEELNIIIQIMSQQIELVQNLHNTLKRGRTRAFSSKISSANTPISATYARTPTR
ncbi:hypothetical protein DM02DRAFT_642928 [Periconia macrospinosa]|uniref:Uncharacterized protein n=1 Tax=Periconia macrospinosa TaxID=97972 RepID=A0A2V1DNE4_9PLEO|nr:hypothetical protein DM02DRAFT_642928 [Periconia macrospinosa]